jgi:hypothetical protein
MRVKSAHAGEDGDARRPPFTLSTITYKVVVYAPADRAHTVQSPYFSSSSICNLWFAVLGQGSNTSSVDYYLCSMSPFCTRAPLSRSFLSNYWLYSSSFLSLHLPPLFHSRFLLYEYNYRLCSMSLHLPPLFQVSSKQLQVPPVHLQPLFHVPSVHLLPLF